MSTSRSKVMKIRGQVVPGDWDANDVVTAVKIYDEDEDREYIVESGALDGELIELVDEYVEVTGKVRLWNGEYYLDVRDFEAIDDPDLEEEESWADDLEDEEWPEVEENEEWDEEEDPDDDEEEYDEDMDEEEDDEWN